MFRQLKTAAGWRVYLLGRFVGELEQRETEQGIAYLARHGFMGSEHLCESIGAAFAWFDILESTLAA
jgi:hypothetical protein